MSSLPRNVRDLPAKVIRLNAAVGVLHSLMPKGRLDWEIHFENSM